MAGSSSKTLRLTLLDLSETPNYENDSEGGLKPTLQARANIGPEVGWVLAHLQSCRSELRMTTMGVLQETQLIPDS